jgi:hypothetical protein
MAIDIGLIGYNTYYAALGGVDPSDGRGLLKWNELDKTAADAWRAAAVAILQYIDTERARLEDPDYDAEG